MDGERTVLCCDWLTTIKHRLGGSTGDGDFIAVRETTVSRFIATNDHIQNVGPLSRTVASRKRCS